MKTQLKYDLLVASYFPGFAIPLAACSWFRLVLVLAASCRSFGYRYFLVLGSGTPRDSVLQILYMFAVYLNADGACRFSMSEITS